MEFASTYGMQNSKRKLHTQNNPGDVISLVTNTAKTRSPKVRSSKRHSADPAALRELDERRLELLLAGGNREPKPKKIRPSSVSRDKYPLLVSEKENAFAEDKEGSDTENSLLTKSGNNNKCRIQ